jgi:beta-galactosidase
VGDRATVFLGGRPLGTVQGGGSVVLPGSGRPELLTVLIESLGRVNYGPGLGERKGLRTPALIERRMIQHWTATPLPVDRWDTAVLDRLAATAAGSPAAGPIGAAPVAADAGVLTASFELDAPADAHLALPGSGKGFAWLNGFLLGRYWSIGPQQTLYVPAPRLRAGRNELLLLELENRGGAAHFGARPELGPTEQYIEEF